MDEDGRGVDRAGRRSKRFLTPLQKYESWLALLRQEVTPPRQRRRTGSTGRRWYGSARSPNWVRWRRCRSPARAPVIPPSPAHNTEPVLRDTSCCSCSVPTDVDRAVPVEVPLTT